MPKDELKPEKDGDPTTSYEDTNKHERTGFRADENDRIKEGGDWDGIDL